LSIIKSFLNCSYFLKSKVLTIFNSISKFNIFITSNKFFTQITSIQGIIEASKQLSFGTKILLNHFSFAQIVVGKILETFLNFQSKDNSQMKIESFTNLSLICPPFNKIQIAIGKSKLGHDFLISAGARFTVILLIGNLFELDLKADFILSLLS